MGNKQDDNLLYMFLQAARRAWWSRPGYEPIGQTLETIDALGIENRAGLKPVIAHKHRTPQGWHLVMNLPPGISSQDIIGKLPHFEEQVGGRIYPEAKGNKLHLDISTVQLPTNVPFEWMELPEKMWLPVPIGQGIAGPVIIDLADLPHMFVAGNTGGGKTTFLRVASMALLQQENVFVVVIDLKGLDFGYLQNHALLVDTESGASEVLYALNNEMDRRRRILRAAGATKLQEYRKGDLPWIVCIIDELAELRQKVDQENLSRLGRLARAVGISLMVATQRPSHTLFSKFTDLRMLFAGRLVFSMPSPDDSRLILDSESASKIPAAIKGRAVWRWTKEEEVQGYNLTIAEAKQMIAALPAKTWEGGNWYEQRAERLLPR
jgi:S-DNA-T family DNA segregation ATPase FtsK/SpoIIIE